MATGKHRGLLLVLGIWDMAGGGGQRRRAIAVGGGGLGTQNYLPLFFFGEPEGQAGYFLPGSGVTRERMLRSNPMAPTTNPQLI